MNGWEWQRTGQDEWVFGTKVRGMVRNPVGEIYYNEDIKEVEDKQRNYGWVWFTRNGEVEIRGIETSRGRAAKAVEEALGIKE
jgi:hypothetical protein